MQPQIVNKFHIIPIYNKLILHENMFRICLICLVLIINYLCIYDPPILGSFYQNYLYILCINIESK